MPRVHKRMTNAYFPLVAFLGTVQLSPQDVLDLDIRASTRRAQAWRVFFFLPAEHVPLRNYCVTRIAA